MDIKTVTVKKLIKSGFNSLEMNGVKHVKILPFLSVVQSLEGYYEITLGNNKTLATQEGGFFIAPKGIQQTIIHHENKNTKKCKCRWLFIEVEINHTHTIDDLYDFPTVINDERKDRLNELFNSIFEKNDYFKNCGDAFKLISLLIEWARLKKGSNTDNILDAVIYINENYQEQITVKTLAKISKTSESNFYTAFKKRFSISPIAYLNKHRLSLASLKLIETNQSISSVCYSVGFSDPLYFSKLFKKNYQMSPKQYRQTYKTS